MYEQRKEEKEKGWFKEFAQHFWEQSRPGYSVPLGRASSLYYKQEQMQWLQLVFSNLLHSHRCRGDIKWSKFSGNTMIWLEAAVSLEIRLGTIRTLHQSLCQKRDQATGFWGYFNMLKHSFTLSVHHGRPKRVIFLSYAELSLQAKITRKVKGNLMKLCSMRHHKIPG